MKPKSKLCVVCGKPGKHYFGEFNINMKTSEYWHRIVGFDPFKTKRVKNEKYDPKAKPKMIEYWECDKCFKEGERMPRYKRMLDRLGKDVTTKLVKRKYNRNRLPNKFVKEAEEWLRINKLRTELDLNPICPKCGRVLKIEEKTKYSAIYKCKCTPNVRISWG